LLAIDDNEDVLEAHQPVCRRAPGYSVVTATATDDAARTKCDAYVPT